MARESSSRLYSAHSRNVYARITERRDGRSCPVDESSLTYSYASIRLIAFRYAHRATHDCDCLPGHVGDSVMTLFYRWDYFATWGLPLLLCDELSNGPLW